MESVNNSLLKKIIFALLISCVNFYSYAQKDEVKITLRDYHSARITAAKASSIYPYFFTADEAGKVLVYSTETKRAVKTLRPANGIPVKSLRLSNDDRVLTINQKYNFSDGKTDSIISISIFDQKILMQNAGNVEFVGSQDDAILLRDTNADGSLNIIDVFNKNFEKVTRFYSSYTIDEAAYNISMGEIAMIQKRGITQFDVLLLYKDDYKKKLSITIPESQEIINLFYDANELYALTTNKTSITIEIHNLSKTKDFSKPLYKSINDFNGSLNVHISQKENTIQFVMVDKYGFRKKPLIIEKTGDKYKDIRPNVNNGVTASVYLNDKNEHVFFEPFNSNFSSYIRFSVVDNDSKKIKKTIPEEIKPYYYSSFLPNDSWVVLGSEINTENLGIGQTEHQLKYYEPGTFSNRFGKLDYDNYLEAKHRIEDFSNKEFSFNKYTGVHPFYGAKKISDLQIEYGFCTYNLMNDEVSLLSTIETGKRNIVDYNSETKTLLLSEREYYNDGHTEPQQFAILKDDKLTDIEGLYKFGKFSSNGRYLLLISKANDVSIRLVEGMKILHTETLINGKYKVFADQSNEFLVSNAYWTLDKEKCNTSSIGFSIDAENKVISQTSDCVNVLDFDSVDDITVLTIESLGIAIGEKIYKFPYSEFPTRVSLNSDGSKVMASFNNGKIRVYETQGLKLLAEMLHPDKSSHVFVDNNNHYFSNIKPDDFVLATLNGKSSPVQDFEVDYFKPEEILKSFGKPNKDYVTVLNKALSLKRRNQYESTEVSEDKTNFLSNEKGELFVLSIGVSDYKQADYNLTFADKDALDIARIYGNLSEVDNETYYEKFFGFRYNLQNNSGEVYNELRRYEGLYKRYGNLYALNIDRSLWLEHDYGKFNLLNYKTGTIESIKMPEGFKIDPYSDSVYINPDGTGFYIVSEDNVYYEYSFLDKKFTRINLPFDIDYATISRSTLKPIKNNRWVYFAYKTKSLNNYAEVAFGETGKEGVTRKIKFNLDNFQSIKENGIKQKDSANIYLATLEAISSNGSHILYSGYDNDLFYADLSDSSVIPLKLNIKNFDRLDDVSISDDGSKLSIVKKQSNDYKYEVFTYEINGKLIRNHSYDIDVLGISGYDNELFWVKSSDPLVKEDYFKNDSLLAYNQPQSFKKTNVKYLTNGKATSEKIKYELKNFFKKVKPNDQIIVFLAGHGVLDEDLNYYFAPHDMLFDNVKTKGVSFNAIIENLKQANTKNILLLMDSCHSGNTLDIDTKTVASVDDISQSNQRGSKSRRVNSKLKFKVSDVISDLFEDFLSKSGVTVISASSGEDVAYENTALGNGAFTSAYISTLKNRLKLGGFSLREEDLKKSISLTDEAISELLKQVMLLTNGKQTPDLRELNKVSKIKMW